MADVHVLPGVERRDLSGAPLPTEEVLQAAIDVGLLEVVIVGRDRTGQLYVACSDSDADRSVGLLMRAVTYLSSATIENSVVIETDPAG